MPKEYVIVKYAGVSWEDYFDRDPKTGVTVHATCSFTHTGKRNGIERTYSDLDKAKRDCIKMNRSNPCGDYGVCEVIDYNGDKNG